MITLPVTAGPSKPGSNAPRLEYDFYTRDTGRFVVQTYLSPTLNFHNIEGIRFAVSLDEEVPVIVNMHQQSKEPWDLWVANNINILNTIHHITEPGIHTLKWWRVDAGVVLQKIVIRKNDRTDSTYLGPPESIRITP